MNTKIFNMVAFGAGLLVGSIATYTGMKKQFEDHVNEELNAIKEYYKTAKEAKDKPDLDELVNDIQKDSSEEPTPESLGYIPGEEEEPANMFEVIKPMEFGSEEEYDEISFTYYADGVLANELNEEVTDIAKYLGDSNALNRFGEYEEDSVFVRNHILKADIEILLDESTYSDIRKSMPEPIVEG